MGYPRYQIIDNETPKLKSTMRLENWFVIKCLWLSSNYEMRKKIPVDGLVIWQWFNEESLQNSVIFNILLSKIK